MLTQIKTDIVEAISPVVPLEKDVLFSLLESPKNKEHGQLSLPVFQLAKTLKKAPSVIAQEIAEKIGGLKSPILESIDSLHGFVNFKISPGYLQKVIEISVFEAGEKLGERRGGVGKKVVIDFSSPNVAKPMHVGHLRATVIGQCICNLARSQGYEVIGLNHLGDWGTQFGKLAWAYEQWGSEYDIENEPIDSLLALYVRFHEEADRDPEIEKKGAAEFKKLENGDPKVHALWEKIVELSFTEYNRLWALLGVKHELVRGESFYNDRMAPVEKELEDKGLLVESEGAMVVEMDDPKMPPCLIRKSDGASLYATRDLASALYRKNELQADLSLYVVGVDQTLHFRQVFEVLKKMGYDWYSECVHISFGMYRFKDIGSMSTRKGNLIRFEDVINKAIDMVADLIESKNPDLKNKTLVSTQVGVGAIIFNDLLNDRVKDVEFDWQRVLDFEGDSGPYVQYSNVRCKSLMRKNDSEIFEKFQGTLGAPEEVGLMFALLKLEDVLHSAFTHYKPHLVSTYLLEVCKSFSAFYTNHKILDENIEVRQSRMTLVKATHLVIEKGLKILNIPCPEAM